MSYTQKHRWISAAHETLSSIRNGIRPPSAGESELEFELRVTIECIRFGMKRDRAIGLTTGSTAASQA